MTSEADGTILRPPTSVGQYQRTPTKRSRKSATAQAVPSLAALRPGTVVRINPYDFDRLGVGLGDRVVVRSARQTFTLPVTRDPGVPRGAAALVVNQPDVRVTDLIDAHERVTELRIETAP